MQVAKLLRDDVEEFVKLEDLLSEEDAKGARRGVANPGERALARLHAVQWRGKLTLEVLHELANDRLVRSRAANAAVATDGDNPALQRDGGLDEFARRVQARDDVGVLMQADDLGRRVER